MEKLGGQGTVQWLMDRVGKVTASRFCDVMAKLKSGASAKARDDYLFELVVERLTGQPTDHYISKPMQDGIEREPFARMKYEAATGIIVEEVGFLPHPAMASVGGSPDGLCGNDGMIEIKCPTAQTHIRTILDGMSADHVPQIQGLLWITGRKWADFISYYPDLPAPLDLVVQRVERDEEYITKLAVEVAMFDADVTALIERLRQAAKESAPQEGPVSASAGSDVGAPTPADSVSAPPAAADPAPEYITPDQALTLETLCQDYGVPLETFKQKAGVKMLSQIHASRYGAAVKWLNGKSARGEAK